MVIKKRVILTLIIAIALLLMTSCGQTTDGQTTDTGQNNSTNTPAGNTSDDSEGSEPADDQVDVTKISGNVVYAVYSWGVEEAEAIVAKFNEMYPNINVQITSFEGDLTPYLTTQAASGTLPDVVFGWENLTYPISQGWVHPLDEFLEKDPEVKYLPDNLLSSYKFGGKIYAVPTQLQFNAIMVNLDLIEQLNMDPPSYEWTVDEFKEYLIKATTDTYSGINHLWDFENVMTGVFSKELHQMAYDPVAGQFRFTDEAFNKAISLQKELKAIPGLVSDDLKNQELRDQGKEDDYQKKFGKDADAFREGKVLTGFHGTWDLSWIKTMNYRYDMYPLPQDPNVGFRQAVHADHAFMTSTAKNPDAAYQFLKWISFGKDGLLARMEYLKNYVNAEGNPDPSFIIPPSTHPDVVAYFKALDIVPGGIKYMYDNIDKTFRADYYKIVPGWSTIFDEIVYPKNEEIRQGKVEVSAVAAELEQKANEALKQFWEEFNNQLAAIQK